MSTKQEVKMRSLATEDLSRQKQRFETQDSQLQIYNNQQFKLLGRLMPEDYDEQDVGAMFYIEMEDGKSIQAFEDEVLI